MLEEGEACDDGPDNGSYGHCATDCSGPGPRCGDGDIQADEICDDRVNDGAYDGCNPGCASLGPYCGDGVEHAIEDCDDGNPTIGDGCNPDCIASGTLLWATIHDGLNAYSSSVIGLGITDAGEVVVATSEEEVAPYGYVPAVFGFDAEDGAALWAKIAIAEGFTSVTAYELLIEDADAFLIVGTGRIDETGSTLETWLGRVAPSSTDPENWLELGIRSRGSALVDGEPVFSGHGSTGTPVGLIRHPAGWEVSTADADFGAVAVGPDGAVVVSAWRPDGEHLLAKYDAGGALAWEHTIFAAGEVIFADVASIRVDADDRITAVGETNGGSQGFAFRLDAEGGVVWELTPSSDTWADAAPTDEGDTVLVSHEIIAATLARLDASGSASWSLDSDELGLGYEPRFERVAIGADGTVFVAGDRAGDIWLARFAP